MKKRLALLALGLAVLGLALLAAALALVDTPAVQAELRSRLSRAIDGQVAWQALDIGLLPPRAELRRLVVEIPEKIRADAEEVRVALRFWPLLRGSVEISTITLARPRIRIAPGEGGSDAPVDAMKAYRAVLEPVARALREHAPGMTLRVDDAALHLPWLEIHDLKASA